MTLRLDVAGSFLFRPALHVAMEVGPSHHASARVWRMASEDSGPILPSRPFLLIVRTGRIVTARKRASSAGYSDVPAYSQIL